MTGTGVTRVFERCTLGELVDASSDGVVVVDPTGAIVYWNAGAERIFGYRAGDAIGASLDLIIPERFRERHWRAFERAVATGESRYGAGDLLSVPAQTSDGRTISIEFTVVLLREDEAIGYVGAVVRDVTERRSREIELRRRLAAKLEAAGSQVQPDDLMPRAPRHVGASHGSPGSQL